MRIRSSNRLVLRSEGKVVQSCTFNRVEFLVPSTGVGRWALGGVFVTGFGEVLLGLDNRDLVNGRDFNVSPRHLDSCTGRVGRIRRVNIRVNVIVNNNGVFHKLDKDRGKFSHIGNSRVNVYTAIVGSLTLDDTLNTLNIGGGILATVHVRPVNRFCAG